MNPLTYAPRLVKAFPPLTVCGRTLKTYGLFADPELCSTLPEPEWLEKQVADIVGEPLQPEDHAVGFLILHFGMDGNYLLVSQWYDANNLKHWVRGAQASVLGDATFAPLTQPELVACVWELQVMGFERDAWVNTVLARGRIDQAALDAYLATTFSGWV